MRDLEKILNISSSAPQLFKKGEMIQRPGQSKASAIYVKKGVINWKLVVISVFLVLGSLVGIYIGSYLVTHNIIDTVLIWPSERPDVH